MTLSCHRRGSCPWGDCESTIVIVEDAESESGYLVGRAADLAARDLTEHQDLLGAMLHAVANTAEWIEALPSADIEDLANTAEQAIVTVIPIDDNTETLIVKVEGGFIAVEVSEEGAADTEPFKDLSALLRYLAEPEYEPNHN